ncbi:MAG: hypothetical protein HFH36_04875 [Lachnospiraceae bacterium]|nr:hypothetical protein [Lachnospiraceae bacterium]
MGILRKMRSIFHEDWCNLCQSEMDVMHKQLYALPDLTVGHYRSEKNPAYYKKHLVPVAKKAEIPAGIYACGIHLYRCPKCGNRRTMLTLFLPVRDEEKIEEIIYFDNGELDEFIYQPGNGHPDLREENYGQRQDSSDYKYHGPYDYS